MDIVGPRPKDKVKASRTINVTSNVHVKVVKAKDDELKQVSEGTSGVILKHDGKWVVVSLSGKEGPVVLKVARTVWGDYFEPEQKPTAPPKLKLKVALKVAGNPKVKVVSGDAPDSLPKGTPGTPRKGAGRKVTMIMKPNSSKPPVLLEMETAYAAKLFEPA